eukprot:5355470-Prymnesium_polylepis.1
MYLAYGRLCVNTEHSVCQFSLSPTRVRFVSTCPPNGNRPHARVPVRESGYWDKHKQGGDQRAA